MIIYFPMSCRILTNGHIKCIRYLKKRGDVLIGLLTGKAMKGYKSEWVPFKDRIAIMRVVARGLGVNIVPQDSLDPSDNIKKYKPTAIATGDGWEKSELKAIKQFKLKVIKIKLKKEYSSSKICCNQCYEIS